MKIKRILKSSPAENYRNIMTGVNAPFFSTCGRVYIETLARSHSEMPDLVKKIIMDEESTPKYAP